MTDQKLVVFAVGKQEYAVPISVVREILAWMAPTPVPEAPPIVEGVVELRGEILPVVDLGKRFGRPRLKPDADARIMIMDLNGRNAGWIVDDVVEVHTASVGAIAPPSPLLANLAGSVQDGVVSGILKIAENRLVVVLDAFRILEVALQ
jgi:purine-binding chemotaxis protein CheW